MLHALEGGPLAVLASVSSLAGCRACQHGDVEEAASLQQPLLGSARAASLGGLPESVKSPFGVRLSAVVPASRGASDGCDGAEVLGGPIQLFGRLSGMLQLLSTQLCKYSAAPRMHRIPDGPNLMVHNA